MESTISADPDAEQPNPALAQLKALTLREMAAAWRSGINTPAERWLERHPQICAHPDVAVRIIYEEVCLREDRGEVVESAEIYARFPQWREDLQTLFDCQGLLQAVPASANFPAAGQRLGEFQLLCELGRGAVGRVFLATQPGLSDRPLVVKLTPRTGDEHLSLARLQHTHIAPLYLVQDFVEENLRALCLPYLGGDSWAHLLSDLNERPPAERSGRQIIEMLEAAQTGPVSLPTPSGPALRFLSRATYVQAICWIGSCLADALHYAHQRGLVHLDIKPSNVLLAADGQPMLLDFHLAREVLPAGSQHVHRLGGTEGFMSPEQQQATAAVREGRPLEIAVDHRSDIYSLGVLLYESLAVQLPSADEGTSRGTLRLRNPLVGRGLEDVLQKCLARDPNARYADAGELAADLRRHLADLPLVGVPNHSLSERWQKWRRRKPHSLGLMAMALVALTAIGGFALLFHGERLREARTALVQGRQQVVSHDYSAAIEQLEGGWDAIRLIPGQYDLKESIQAQLALARRSRLAETLHQLVERLRFVESSDSAPVARLSELEAGCRRVWQARLQIVERDAAASNLQLDDTLRDDLLDLAVMWANLQIRLAPADKSDQARRDALKLLDEAQGLLGSSLELELARRECSAALPLGEQAHSAPPPVAPRTVWEHYAVGRWYYRTDKLPEARAEFREAIRLEPSAFWPNFYLALCAYRLEHFDEALGAAAVCVALSPRSAECFYNRALAHQALGHTDAALGDFSQALELDPRLAVAALHRGMLRAQMGHYADAQADLQTALSLGADPAVVCYQAALVDVAREDQAAALENLRRSLQHDPSYAPAVALKTRLERHP